MFDRVFVCVISSKFVKLSRKFGFPADVGVVIDSNNFVLFQEINHPESYTLG